MTIRGRRADALERLAAALERMLAKYRADRYVSAAGVIAALRPFAAGAPRHRCGLKASASAEG
jgi:hypothetical protein